MPETLSPWQQLACPCGGTTFTQLHGLRRSASGGLVATAVGWECTQCHTAADVQKMLRAAEIKRLQQQIAAQQAELDAADPTPRSAPDSTT